MGRKIKGLTVQLNGDATGMTKALRQIKQDSKNVQYELKDVERALKLDPGNTDMLRQKQELLSKSIYESKNALKALQDSKAQADKDMANGTEVSQSQYRKLQREISKAESNVKLLETQSKEFGSVTMQHLKLVGDKFDTVGQKVTDVGKQMTKVSVAVGTGLGASAKFAVDFEDAMAKVSTIADTTAVPIDTLRQQILSLSDETGVGANAIAEDVYNAISAGQDTAKAVNFVLNSIKLAKGGFAESSQALDILTTTLNAYGMEAEKVTDVSDMLIQIQNKGKTTVADLSSNMGKVIPTAKANGVALEQLGASYAIMTSKGIATAETTTYINSMLNELGKSGTGASDTLKNATGKTFQDLMGSGKSLADVLEILDENAQANNVSLSDMFSSAEAGKAALVLLGDGADTFNSSINDMQNSAGATDKAFEKMQTTSQDVKETLNEVKNTAIDFGATLIDMMKPSLEKARAKISEVSEHLKNLTDSQKETILKIAALVVAIGPALIILGKLTSAVKILMSTISLLCAHPLVAVVAALGLLAIKFGVARYEAEKETEAMKKAREEHEALTGPIEENIKKYDELKEAQKQSTEKALEETEMTKALWEELQTLADENGNVKEADKDRAEFIVGELSDAMGTEIDMVGDQIQGYKDLQTEIDNYLSKRQGQILLEQGAESYTQAKTGLYEYQTGNADLKIGIADKQKQIEELFATTKAKITQEEAHLDEISVDSGGLARSDDLVRQVIERRTNEDVYNSGLYKQLIQEIEDDKKLFEENSKMISDSVADIQKYENLQTSVATNNYDEISSQVATYNVDIKTALNSTKEELQSHVTETGVVYFDLLEEYRKGNSNITQAQLNNAKEMYSNAQTEYKKAGGAIPENIAKGIEGNSYEVMKAADDLEASLVSWATGLKINLYEDLDELKTTINQVNNIKTPQEILAQGNGPVRANSNSDTNSGSQTTIIKGVTIDAHNVKDFTDVVSMVQRQNQARRAF